MTLQKIADAVGVGVGTVHRAIDGAELFHLEKLPGDDGKYRPMHYAARTVELIINSDIENERGQLRPMHYASRAVDTLGSKLRPTLDAISMHYAARAVDTPVRMPPTAPRTGAALRLPVFSSGSTAIPPQNGLQRAALWPVTSFGGLTSG